MASPTFRELPPFLAHFLGSGNPRQCRLVAASLGGQQPEVALEFQTTSFGFEKETFVYQHHSDGTPTEKIAVLKWTTDNMLGTVRMGERQVHMADLVKTVASNPNCRAFQFAWPQEEPMVCMWHKVGADTYELWVNTECLMEYHPGVEVVAGEADGDPARYVFGTVKYRFVHAPFFFEAILALILNRWIDHQQVQLQ